MAFYVEKEEEWYIATDLETKVASQGGKTASEACSNLEGALELYTDGEKNNRGEGRTLAECLIIKMNAYVERLKKMSPEEAEEEATECLKKSGILLENGELNEAMFQESKYRNLEKEDESAIQTVKQAWDFAFALNKMAGLTPSEDFLEIIEMEKRGEIQREDVKKFLEQKYGVTMKD